MGKGGVAIPQEAGGLTRNDDDRKTQEEPVLPWERVVVACVALSAAPFSMFSRFKKTETGSLSIRNPSLTLSPSADQSSIMRAQERWLMLLIRALFRSHGWLERSRGIYSIRKGTESSILAFKFF